MVILKKSVIFLFTLLTMFCVCALSEIGNAQTHIDLSSYRNLTPSGNYEYLFEDTIDLKGATVHIPPNSTLIFHNGFIRNGCIIGDSTIIQVYHKPIFDNMKIDGSWIIKEISTKLFATVDSCTLNYLSILSSDKQFNIINIEDECTTSIKPWSSNFIIKSNTDLYLNADIYTLPTDCDGGYCINVIGENIKIQGNHHYLFGTISDPRQIKCSEWLHGLNIDRNSSKIVVENLNSWMFCGDGFYNAGSKVIFENINAKFNGRQGLSITNGEDIQIKNSSFTNTGYFRLCTGKGPGAGIDIEPNKDNSINNIEIKNCVIINNYRYIKGYINDIEIYKTNNGQVLINNCVFGGMYLGSCYNIILEKNHPRTIYRIDERVSIFNGDDEGQNENQLKSI